jgi:phosphoglycerol transferase MdoB-like AlkP superfamily enzyme
MDVWGIDDASLFVEANWVLRKQDRPFFAIIQTAGNHRPYHIPEDSYGFELRNVDKEQLRKNGFTSEEEFNAFRFLDYSVGYFIKQARKEPYFENTIFVFYGDHGIVGYPGDHSPSYLNHTQLTGMQTPLIFYAPKLLKPRRLQEVASELDLLPTIAGLAGTEYTNTTLGRDLLDPRFDKDRYAFIFTHSSDYMLGLLSKDYYLTVLQDGSKTVLYDINAKDDRENVAAAHPEQTDKMRNLALGIFETTKYMLHHNKPDKQ